MPAGMTWTFHLQLSAPSAGLTAVLDVGPDVSGGPLYASPPDGLPPYTGQILTALFRYGRGNPPDPQSWVSTFGTVSVDGLLREVDVTLNGVLTARVLVNLNPGDLSEMDVTFFGRGSDQVCWAGACGAVVGTIAATLNVPALAWQNVWDDGTIDSFYFVLSGTPGTGGSIGGGFDTIFNRARAITASNTVNYDGSTYSAAAATKAIPAEAIYVGGAGDVVAVFENGSTNTYTCTAGEILNLKTIRVNSTNTTATGLVALSVV